MKVVHLCMSHVSNLPLLWARAMRERLGWQSVMIYGAQNTWSGWPIDLWVKRSDPESQLQAEAHIRGADVVIFHGHAHSRFGFGGLNVTRLVGDKPVLHLLAVSPFLVWGSSPLQTWRAAAASASEVPPMLVDPGMLRAFPHGRLVPLFVPAFDEMYQPSAPEPSDGRPLRLLLATTNPKMKRVPEMLAGIELLKRRSTRPIELDYITKVDHAELMRRKRRADIIFDMMLGTGGWGMNGAESAALGRPLVAWFDDHACDAFRRTLGCETFELVNLPPDPEQIAAGLLPLVEDEALRLDAGRRARRWVEDYWSDRARAPLLASTIESLTQQTRVGLEPRRESA